MKTRIRKTIAETYRVEYKGWIFWHYYGETQCSYGGDYFEPYIYDTEEEALAGLAKMVQEAEDLKRRTDAAGTILEIDSNDIKNKLAEYFV